MKTKNIIEGLTILEKYRNDPDGYNCGAEHDVIYAYTTDAPVEEKDVLRLIEIGWCQEGIDSDEDDEFNIGMYDPEEGWYCFV